MEISPDVHWVGVNDTESKFFESLWSIPKGVSLNSYLVLGEKKKTLIDTVNDNYFDEYIENLKRLIDPEDIDYIVINHVEPDHAGSLSKILSIASKASVISSKMGIDFVKYYHQVPFNDISVDDGDKVDLGGKTLKFIMTPCIHWPETMCTFLGDDGILFSGDLFGAFDSIGDEIFDDKIGKDSIYSAKRYFTSILSPYYGSINSALKKLGDLQKPCRVIAPSHGLIYRNDPSFITKLYADLCSGKFEEKVVILYGSMYGNTKVLAEAVSDGVKDKCVKVALFNATYDDPSEILTELWKAPAIAVGSPVYDCYIFPPITNLLELIKVKRIRQRVFGLFGDYTWGGGPLYQLQNKIKELGSEVIGSFVKSQGSPTANNIESAIELGNLLAEKAIKNTKESSALAPVQDPFCPT
ncbi:MAG: FprA family A-type flavoprotein [Nitrososphaerales archaeon]|jgi:flavorubredoxin|nr:FprA family A-type flavoprotein [Nitrososphaerales archaeon]HJN58395.1 FprA family A-type flavoprotein [Nitrososphaerales archaeon]|tara:strand:+ start:3176 stop:4411 length:1236 start_codon:yes stop_codon:yes gene_type:complete